MALGNGKCDRCNEQTNVQTMSRFNTQMICMNCETIEKAHPDYEEARDKEMEQVKAGNRNYEGIGLPDDLKNPDLADYDLFKCTCCGKVDDNDESMSLDGELYCPECYGAMEELQS